MHVILTSPFRGYDESPTSFNRGNFLSVIELLATYDPLLKAHIDNNKSKVKYFSPKIQNELISLLPTSVLYSIICKIKEVPFASILLDTTQDISKVD